MCDLENWKRWSEMCGDCVYKFEFTSGVPQSLIGVRTCLGAMEGRPYIEAANMDIQHPYNGKILDVVTHSNSGCSAEDFTANITDTIAFVDYHTPGCGYTAKLRAARQQGSTLGILSYAFYTSYTDNKHYRLFHDSDGLEDTVTMQWRSGAKDVEVLKTLREATGRVQGRVIYECGADYNYANSEADLSEYYGGDTCPWWLLHKGSCEDSPDESARLCSQCPVSAYHPETREVVACLQQTFLSPTRARNSLQHRYRGRFPVQETIIFIDENIVPGGGDFLCNASNFDESWRGKVLASYNKNTIHRSGVCSRVDSSILAGKAGMAAHITMYNHAVHGFANNVVIATSAIILGTERTAFKEFMEGGLQLSPGIFERKIVFGEPEAHTWQPTPAPPSPPNDFLLIPDETSDSVFSEPSFVVGAVLTPILCALLCAKLWWSSRSHTKFSEGIPLGIASTLLSLSLAGVLVAVTYVLASSAGHSAEATQRENKEEALRVMNARDSASHVERAMERAEGQLLSVSNPALEWMRHNYEKAAFYRNFVSYSNNHPDSTPTAAWWAEKSTTLRNLLHVYDGVIDRWSIGCRSEVLLGGGYYIGPTAELTNGTYIDTRTKLPIGPSFDPLTTLWWGELPPEYNDTISFLSDYAVNRKTTYLGELQVTHTNTFSDTEGNGKLSDPFFSSFARVRSPPGFVVSSYQVQTLSHGVKNELGKWGAGVGATASSLFAVYTAGEGRILAQDTTRSQVYRVVDELGVIELGYQDTYQTFTLFDSIHPEFNAMGNYLISQYGQIDPGEETDNGPIVRRFKLREHYEGYTTEWLHLPLETNINDVSWHNWDTFAECKDLICPNYTQNNQARFDGTNTITVSPYLTKRVPRVAAREGHNTFRYYRESRAVGGVQDVVVQRGVNGSYTPAYRERMFKNNEYSVSVWMRLDTAMFGRRGVIITDSLAADAALRFHTDGSAWISMISYGCKTGPIRDLPLQQWVFLTLTVRFVGEGYCAVYINGVQRTRALTSVNLGLSRVRTNMTIGHELIGDLRDLRVHNVSLSQEAIVQLKESGSAKYIVDHEMLLAASKVMRNVVVAVLSPLDETLADARRDAERTQHIVHIQNRNTSNALQRENAGTIMVAVAVLFAGALLFVVVNEMLTQPISTFAKEITRIAEMEVEGLTPQRNALKVREIVVMQTAVDTLVANMRAYKGFLPLTMQERLRDDTDNTDNESEQSMQASPIIPDTPSFSTPQPPLIVNVLDSPSRQRQQSLQRSPTRLGCRALVSHALAKRCVGFLAVNVVNFHKEVLGIGVLNADKEACPSVQKHAAFIAVCTTVAHSFRGVPETFAGDRVAITFNAARPLSSYRSAASAASIAVQERLREETGLRSSSAVTAGAVLCGHLGVETMMRYSTLGMTVSWLYAMERFARWNNKGVVCDRSIYAVGQPGLWCMPFAVVTSEKAPVPEQNYVLAEITPADLEEEDGWIQEMASLSVPVVAEDVVALFDAVAVRCNWEQAVHLLERVRATAATLPAAAAAVELLAPMIETHRVTAQVIRF